MNPKTLLVRDHGANRRDDVVRGVASCLAIYCLLAPVEAAAIEPIKLHPENRHYFLFRERPTILVTSGEHYGAVLNQDFNYIRYLDALKAHGFNLTRTFSGTYREVTGSFDIKGNTLAPATDRYLCPWARSQVPGATDGGNKFDLATWDQTYFDRLKDFITQAGQRGIVVELVLFCTMYNDALWAASPMNARNNTHNIGKVGRNEVFGGHEKELLAVQQAVTRKIVSELKDFDNVYFEVCNEPYERGGLTREWNDAIVTAIVEAEAGLPARHLIAQNLAHGAARAEGLSKQVSVLNFHAATPEAVRLNYDLNLVIASDETGGSDRSDRKYRTDGWEFLLSGGAVFDHLDFSFTIDRPDGWAVPLPPGTPGGGGPELRKQLQILKEFVEGFDFVKMSPNPSLLKDVRVQAPRNNSPSRTASTVRILAEAGKAYAIYVNGGVGAELVIDLPPGHYKADWVSTRTGQAEKAEPFTHEGGNRRLISPAFVEDIALRIKRVL
jgi:hypothetical protein